MRNSTPALALSIAIASLAVATNARSEIWDKQLSKADFASFEMACNDDQDVIRALLEGFGDRLAFVKRKVAVVGRIRTSLFDGACLEFRGVCHTEELGNGVAGQAVFFDERELPLWHCPLAIIDKREWKVVKTDRTAYALGLNLRVE